jgi:hypothetical protein
MALRLEAAGPAELAGLEERSPGAITFELFIDMNLVRAWAAADAVVNSASSLFTGIAACGNVAALA